jgi:hypothetical protein
VSEKLHRKELEIINLIDCHVMSSGDVSGMMPLAK